MSENTVNNLGQTGCPCGPPVAQAPVSPELAVQILTQQVLQIGEPGFPIPKPETPKPETPAPPPVSLPVVPAPLPVPESNCCGQGSCGSSTPPAGYETLANPPILPSLSSISDALGRTNEPAPQTVPLPSEPEKETPLEQEGCCLETITANILDATTNLLNTTADLATPVDNSAVIEALLLIQKYLNNCSEEVNAILNKINVNVETKKEASPLQLSHSSKRVVDALQASKGFVKVSSLRKVSGLQASSVRNVIKELRRNGYVIESAAVLHKQNPEVKETQGYRLVSSPVVVAQTKPEPAKTLLTFGEAAKTLGVSTRHIKNLIRWKSLPQVSLSKHVKRVDASDLKAYIKRNKK